MRTIKIFLASSCELETDRAAFEDLLSRKTKLWKDEREIFLELEHWEDYIDKMSKTRLQDEYDKTIRECDIFVMLFWTKVGMYTNEEFEVAYKAFVQKDKPWIYTYFKNAPSTHNKEPSLDQFEKRLKELGHFKTEYKNTEGLLLHFNLQLDKLFHMQMPAQGQHNQAQKSSKSDIIAMLNKLEVPEAFEELTKLFQDKKISLNVLIDEYINPPNNFTLASFVTRVKLFVNRNVN